MGSGFKSALHLEREPPDRSIERRGLHDSGLQSLDFVENDLEAIRAGWGLKATGRLDVGSNAAQ
jgi:hypothetical protein